MAEAAVGATIQVLVENLLTLSKEQIGLLRNFKKDLEKLQKTFSKVKAFLDDAEKKQVTDGAVKIWLRDLEALAFDADNVFDEINYQLLSKKVGPAENKTVMKKVQSFFSCSNNNPIAYRLKLGRRIRDINEKLKSINQQATEFGLQIASAQAPVSGSDASGSTETDSFTVDPIFLGRENDVSRIVEKLITTTQSPAEQVLSVLPIVGMGGLGKTTLARAVFSDEQMISHFGDNRVWVYVSRNFDVCNILKNILTSLTEEKFELETREALLKKLQEHLRTKRYMLVLDDVWNVDKEMWDDFVNSLTGISSATGNRMIVTSRSEEVASIVETLSLLEGKEHWDSLPDQLQHLTSLKVLYLRDFGIEALPEWFGNLSSLRELKLGYCKKLRHLPSKQAMQRLSKLTFLFIYECPLLLLKEKKRSNNNNNDELPQIVDSEWPKISHIPDVYVDWQQVSSDRH